MPGPLPKSPAKDIADAVKDTVVISPRQRVGRSQTSTNTSKQPDGSRPSGTRSQSQDSGTRNEKPKNSSSKSRSKKGSQHADVIDRLDFTGVGPMFHHDGPFDACAPSRNRQRNNAPMYAWTQNPDDHHEPRAPRGPPAAPHHAFTTHHYPDPPKKKNVDAIAEAWGIHEPEPYEEFFAGGGGSRVDSDTPASSIYNGRESSRNGSSHYEQRDQRHNDNGQQRGPTRRPLVPPPKPIFVPDSADIGEPPAHSPPLSPGPPKRTKSLMHRIRRMRDAPNVPVSSDYDAPASPSDQSYPGSNGNRPTHRSNNSFLGRFGGSRNTAASPPERSEPFVYIEASSGNQDKDLPATPGGDRTPPENTQSSPGYIDGAPNTGIGRKPSLMKKMGRFTKRQ